MIHYPRCLYHVTFSAMCGTIGCQQTIASGTFLIISSLIQNHFQKKKTRARSLSKYTTVLSLRKINLVFFPKSATARLKRHELKCYVWYILYSINKNVHYNIVEGLKNRADIVILHREATYIVCLRIYI